MKKTLLRIGVVALPLAFILIGLSLLWQVGFGLTVVGGLLWLDLQTRNRP